MYAPVRMLIESLVPDEPLRPNSMPESQGVGPNQPCGMCQLPCGFSKISFAAGSAATTAGAGQSAPGIGSSAPGATTGGPNRGLAVVVPAGGVQEADDVAAPG